MMGKIIMMKKDDVKMTNTIAMYLRISAEDIDLDGFDKYESNSIANQRRYLGEFIRKMPEFLGFDVIEVMDDGFTGTNFQRPGVQGLLDKVQAGEVQCIIVKDFSRWGRNHIEVGDFIEQKFPAWGVRFISINDNYDSANLNGQTGGIDVGFRNLIYEMYSRDLSEKVRSAQIAASKSGKCVTAVPPYGYVKDSCDKHKLVIDAPSAAVVKRIFDLAAQGQSYMKIATTLNDEGIVSPQGRRSQLGYIKPRTHDGVFLWVPEAIGIIVRDERYTGKLIFGKNRVADVGQKTLVPLPKSEWIVVPDAIPAIVTEEQYILANSIRAKYDFSNRSKPEKSLFYKKLRCTHCGKFMRVVRRKNYNQYRCPTLKITNLYNCAENGWVLENELAEAVLTALRQQFTLSDEAYRKLEAKSKRSVSAREKLNREAIRLQTEIEKAKSQKLGLWEKLQSGSTSNEIFQREFDKADRLIDNNTAKIQELVIKMDACKEETEQDKSAVEQHRKFSSIQSLTRDVIEEFISEIKVYSADRIEIVFNNANVYDSRKT